MLEKPQTEHFITEVLDLVRDSRSRAMSAVNAELTKLNWNIGKRIRLEVLQSVRAEYGKQVIEGLSIRLMEEFGNGWGVRHLWNCLKFAEIFPELEIIQTLSTQLSWSHIRQLVSINDDLKRTFYIEMTKIERWSVRQMQERISSLLYERTAISRKPDETIKNELELLRSEQTTTPDLVFRDPYLLDFLGLHDSYSEKDFESAILAELQRFLIELGGDFAFVARQKRITIDGRDYYIDLLFFHRRLRCLIPIDLKLGEFEAAHKGQMELYLRYLERYEVIDGENSPIGLILCAGKNEEHVDLLQLDKSNIKIADFLTHLPSKDLVLEKLRKAISIAKENSKKDQGGKP